MTPNYGALRAAIVALILAAILGIGGFTGTPFFWIPLIFGLSRLGAFAESFNPRRVAPPRRQSQRDRLRQRRDATRDSVRDRIRQQRGQQPASRAAPSPIETFMTMKPPRARPAAQHAVDAVRRAGLVSENLALRPTDLGLMVYSGGKRPVIHREAAIPDTADYVQPFVELETRQPASGQLRFEIVDSSGVVQYARIQDERLTPGRSLLLAKTRMPVGDFLDVADDWSVRIYAGDVLLADHPFNWYDPDSVGAPLRDHLSSDGELSTDLERLVESAELQPISLDELLGDDASQSSMQRR
jgi:hypothetical protein